MCKSTYTHPWREFRGCLPQGRNDAPNRRRGFYQGVFVGSLRVVPDISDGNGPTRLGFVVSAPARTPPSDELPPWAIAVIVVYATAAVSLSGVALYLALPGTTGGCGPFQPGCPATWGSLRYPM
jgi:hypothetical protein